MDSKNKFDFVRSRNKFFGISIVLLIIGLAVMLFSGMNFGVDFKAGTNIDLVVGKQLDKAKVDEILNGLSTSGDVKSHHADPTIGGNNSDRVSIRFDDVLNDDAVNKIQKAFATAYGVDVSKEINTVDPQLAKELLLKAVYAVAIASVLICVYVSIRFEWRFAIAAIIAILHDAFMVIAVFAIFRLEVNLPFLAAVLTTIGYSINDKIVIFDRIRENLRFAKLKTDEDLVALVNDSIWQTMARNINTVLVVLIAAGCLYIFGSESIKLFALAKLVGLTSGAYSSIVIACSLWYLLKRKSLRSSKKKAAA
ncbi:protein translocase subunit SecF [Paenibacillus sp. CGMCC 1.16610]|uniref:Protein-export membrane protein SecF n=3 Tax=Paenibacillus TaxID=44249 RepID=A0ABU3RGU2_9BACL|nr:MULTISPECIES: protein translocase subunit SecF [Paenibacillus]MBA2939264.1 protein translocase subunit SecF [Paenibacillus sp. CGMCC 1.16610]MCY9661081.1 protein translocase subunit SecF [Paenibacillus anseongense]MDU0203465.1 protein translocase subunit SecF [Paenibacillus sp. PFR10]MEB4794798.1 protein translocase subunit SecF [Paenibacillus chondroitinus]MEC0270838.1 protein translocase subunit SecF [Paenibacillus anseongense]